MHYEIALQSEAVNDLQQAFEWYEQQRIGLGQLFLD